MYNNQNEENIGKPKSNHTALSRTFLATAFIIAGLLIIGKRTELISYETFHMLFNWQFLLIAIGIVSISKNKENNIGGYIIILIGTIFLIPEFIDINYDTRELFLPAILIGVGIIILFKGLDKFPSRAHKRFTKGDMNSLDTINDNLLFGGGEFHITSNNFQGGSINAIFGGGKYNFRNAQLAEGVQVLEVNLLFAGLDIQIPEDWDVKLEVTSILGGISNKSYSFNRSVEQKGQLIIRGTAIFGGGEIKRF